MSLPEKPATPTVVIAADAKPAVDTEEVSEETPAPSNISANAKPVPAAEVQKGTEYLFNCQAFDNRLGWRSAAIGIFERWYEPFDPAAPLPIMDINAMANEARRRFEEQIVDIPGTGKYYHANCEFQGITLTNLPNVW
jgi:hypothetical protein